jgi:hypothetical protein
MIAASSAHKFTAGVGRLLQVASFVAQSQPCVSLLPPSVPNRGGHHAEVDASSFHVSTSKSNVYLFTSERRNATREAGLILRPIYSIEIEHGYDIPPFHEYRSKRQPDQRAQLQIVDRIYRAYVRLHPLLQLQSVDTR